MNSRSVLPSVLIAGVVIGLLGNLPILNLVNCVLCLWVWVGGALAIILYRRFQRGQPGPTPAQGAVLGALSGLVGAFLGAVVFFATASISGPILESLARTLQVEGDLPIGAGTPAEYLSQTLIFLVIDVVLYPLFGALSGFIAANMGKAKPAAA